MYQFRVSAGFSLNPPFKGFGMAFLWFAVDEPQLFSLIMDASMPTGTFKGYIDTFVGFKEECLAAIGTSFGLRGSDAEQLYYQMILIALGLAHTCTRGGSTLSIQDSEWAELERVFRNTFNLTPLHNILLLHANRMSMKLRLMVFSVVRSYEIAEGFVRIQICSS